MKFLLIACHILAEICTFKFTVFKKIFVDIHFNSFFYTLEKKIIMNIRVPISWLTKQTYLWSLVFVWVFMNPSVTQTAQVSWKEEGFKDKRKWECNLEWQTSPPACGCLSSSLKPLSVTAGVHSLTPKCPGRRDSRTASFRLSEERKLKCRVSSLVADSCWLMKADTRR